MTEYNVKLRSLKIWEKDIAGMFFEHCAGYSNKTQTGLTVGFFTGLLWCADVPLKTKPLDWKKVCSSQRLDKDVMVTYALEVLDELELLGIDTDTKITKLSSAILEIVLDSIGYKNHDFVKDGELTANFS